MANDVFPPNLPSQCTLDNVAGVFGFNEDTPTGVLFWTGASCGRTATIGILDLRPNGDAAVQ
jgi:hypothetical protein